MIRASASSRPYCARISRPWLLLAALCGLAACAGSRPRPTEPPVPGYERLSESLAGRDLTPLRGRRIVLDPGHGGRFRGAIGPNGLTEADVNLGVALNLRGLLEWAGAQVWLTRSADYDLLSPPDSSLATDLSLRVSFTDSIQPDVFISIHHNSNAALDRTLNETQTYYPLADDGASLDLARSIHRHLVANLGITPASIRPGNFHVLREATVPAVLGEPAMISHPVMAARLSLAASQRLEAEAYLLGLLDYFTGGLPVWSGAALDTVRWGHPDDPTRLSWEFLPDSRAVGRAPGPDPARLRLTLDGVAVTPDLTPDARTVTWTLPPDLAPQPHVLALSGRNLLDRATPRRRTVLLPRTAGALQVTVTVGDKPGPTGIHWSGLGEAPLPLGTLCLPAGRRFAVGPDQPAWQLVDALTAADLAGPWRLTAPGDDSEGQVCALTVQHLPPGRQLRLVTLAGRPFAPAAGWRGRQGAEGNSPLVSVPGQTSLWLEGAGVMPLMAGMAGAAGKAAPAGKMVPTGKTVPTGTVDGAAWQWEATPVLESLLGRVIVLDPAGGDTDTDGTGPLGLRGADLNLAVASHAATLLTGAGAAVHLTRHDETELPAVEKVRLAGRVGADLFLTIGRHAVDGPRVVRHHPGSRLGREWAAAAVRASALLPQPVGGPAAPCQTEESSSYLLRHTACPALEWRLDPPMTSTGELRQVEPGWHRAEARAILLALLAVSGEPAIWDHLLHLPVILAELEPLGGLPAAEVDWAQLDGNLAWSPLPALPTFAATPDSLDSGAGPGLPDLLPGHVLELHAGPRWQVWLVSGGASIRQATLLTGDREPTR